MRFKIPIDLKDRKRYISLVVEGNQERLGALLRRAIKELSGMKGLSTYRFNVIDLGGGRLILRTTEKSIHAILSALLMVHYERKAAIDVRGISGTLRKAKSLFREDASPFNGG